MQELKLLWHARAQRTRDLTPLTTSPTTRDNLRKVAVEYDLMSRQIDERTASSIADAPRAVAAFSGSRRSQ